MVTILLGPTDLARTRFAFSPLWECVAAFRSWQGGNVEPAHHDWTAIFAAVAPNEGWPFLRLVARAPGGAIPDFLAPPPPGPAAEFREELAGLRATPAAVVRSELAAAYGGRLPHPTLGTNRGLSLFLDGVCRELELFWRWAVVPLWPQLRGHLEAEVVYRSRILAFGGTAALFRDLHPSVRFAPRGGGGLLTVRTRDDVQRRAGGAGLLLVPSMFAWPEAYVVARRPWRPTLAYPARGVAALREREPNAIPRGGVALDMLLGASRACVLAALVRPQTTADLAAALSMAPASVSQQLTRLRNAGVLDRVRIGRRVYYSLNESGHALLRIGRSPARTIA